MLILSGITKVVGQVIQECGEVFREASIERISPESRVAAEKSMAWLAILDGRRNRNQSVGHLQCRDGPAATRLKDA